MPPDAAKTAEVNEWLIKAEHDLESARRLVVGSAPLTDMAAFHCQQTAEKALKAFLVWHDVPFRKTHDLDNLGDQCRVLDPTLAELLDRAADLTPYAWRFRYPGEPADPIMSDVDDAIAVAAAVLQGIRERVTREATVPPNGRSL